MKGQDSIKDILFQAEQYVKEGVFDKAADLYNKIADHWKKQEEPDSFFYYKYREASQYSNAYEFEKAALLLEDLLAQLSTQNRRPDFLGQIYYRAGSNYVYLNDFEKALLFLNQCLAFEKNRRFPDTLYIAKATEWKGLTYSYLGELDKATDFIEQALGVRMKVLAEDALEIGYNYNSLGLVYMEMNAFEKADTAFSEALRILKMHLLPTHAHLSSIRSNISTIKSTQGDFYSAKTLLEESIAAHLSEQRFYPLMDDYFNLGTLYLSLDDSEHALPYVIKALELADSILPHPHYTRTNMQDGLAGIYFTEGQYPLADSIFRRSLREKKQLFEPNHPEIGRSYFSLGLVAKELGKRSEVREYFGKSLTIRILALGEDHPATADVLFGQAELDWSEGLYESALQKLYVCLRIYENKLGANHQSYVQTALRLAQLFELLQQPDSVEVYLQKAWSGVLDQKIENRELERLSDFEIRFVDSYVLNLLTFHLEYLNRKTLFSETELRQGRNILLVMDRLLEKMLPLVDFENANRQLIYSIQEAYRQGALLIRKGLGIQQDNQVLQDLLLYCLDQSRAITIRSAVQNRDALQFANVPEEVIKKDRRLREQMRFLKARSEEAENIEQLYFESLENWRIYQQDLKSSYPEWFKLRYDRRPPDKMMITEQLTKDNASLLVFFDLDTSLLVLLMNADSFNNYLLSVPTSWPDSVQMYQQLIENQAAPKRLASLGHYLYQILWAPLRGKLKETVIIVPDGALFYLNFETLLSELPQDEPYQLWPWLILDHTIHYQNQLPETSRRKSKAPGHILAVAPAFSAELKEEYLESLPPGSGPDSTFLSWLRTPWSVDFVRHIGKYGKALIAGQATEQAFLEQAPGAGLLHLGTHARIQDADPLLSFFALYPEPQSSHDGYLHAYELYNLPLQAKLTVLTACQTGLGAYHRGEGVLSLAHAFQYAGCPSVVYSLWSIDDQQSNLLMTDFYEHMQKGISFARALRQAKLDYLEEHGGNLAAPYYWGGMVLIGENSELNTQPSFLSSYWWIPLLLLVLVLITWLFFRKQ